MRSNVSVFNAQRVVVGSVVIKLRHVILSVFHVVEIRESENSDFSIRISRHFQALLSVHHYDWLELDFLVI